MRGAGWLAHDARVTRADPASHFPTTHLTTLLAAPDPRAVVAHVLERYREALVAYASALPARTVAEPAELVDGFVVRRVSAPGFRDAWRASGLPLRRYLMNGLSLDARTVLRGERREAERRRRYAIREATEARDRARREADAEAAFERAWAKAVVAEACERVRAELDASGAGAAWDAFEAHVLRGESYAAIRAARAVAEDSHAAADGAPAAAGRSCAADEAALAVEVRRVGRRLRAALRVALAEEGVPPDEVDRELRLVLARMRA